MSWPVPEPDALERLSPSTAESLLECPLRVGFTRDRRFAALGVRSLAAILGQVAHRLFEMTGRGQFDGTDPAGARERLSEAWISEIDRAIANVEPGALPFPLPSRWPGYQRVRVRTLKALERAITRRAASRRGGRGGATLEVNIRSPSSPLNGRIDRVERSHDGGIQLVDLKTGWRPSDEIPDRVRRQLFLYAVLWYEVHGKWPAKVAVESLEGGRQEIDVVPEEALEIATKASSALQEFNHAVGDQEALAALARPGAEHCEFCDYKASCGAFFDSSSEEWHHYGRSVLGVVTDHVGRGDLISVDIRASRPSHLDGALVRVLSVPLNLAPDKEQQAGFADLGPTRSDTQFEFGYRSRVFVWRVCD